MGYPHGTGRQVGRNPAGEMVALLVLCGLLAGAGKAFADAQAHGSARLARWFPKWAGPESWRLKYRDGDATKGPRFFLADTLLVGLTDLWHAANLLAGLAADAAVVLAWWLGGLGGAVGYVVARRVVFQPLYSWLRK